MIKIGVIGTGDRAIGYLRNTFKKFVEEGLIEVVAVADINPVRAEEGKKDLEAKRSYKDYKELLKDDIDSVFVMTPENAHAKICVDALDMGKNIYCEKPMASTVEGCNEILLAAQKSKSIFFSGHNVRFGTARTVHKLIKEGYIGDVHMVWAKRFVRGGKYWHRWHRYKENSGGLLVHKGVHQMDQMNWNSGGRPLYVSAFGSLDVFKEKENSPERCLVCEEKCAEYIDIASNERHKRYFLNAEKEDGYLRDLCVYAPGSNVFDNAVVAVEYTNGVIGTYMECHFSPTQDLESGQGAVGDKGLISLSRTYDGKGEIRFEDTKTGKVELIKPDLTPPIGDEAILREFIRCIQEGVQPESGCLAGWDSAIIGHAAEKAARTKKVIRISHEDLKLYEN
jgi:predicted dehydrogenase